MWTTSKDGGGGSSKTKANLRASNIKPKKSLGQHFVTDDNVLANIVHAANVRPGDRVLEVGPGTGNLTRHILAAGASVTAVEKDDILAEKLEMEYRQNPNFELVNGDVLHEDMGQILDRMAAQNRSQSEPQSSIADDRPQSSHANIKVLANLPYNITTDFLKLMLSKGSQLPELSIMIQEEVAQRLVSPAPDRWEYRAMSVFVHFYSDPRYCFRIPREKYFPVPGVDGALVTFRLRPPADRPAVPSEPDFLKLVNRAFSTRRKMLRNCLKPLYSPEEVTAALERLTINPLVRAQELSVAQFAALHRALHEAKLAEALHLTSESEGAVLEVLH